MKLSREIVKLSAWTVLDGGVGCAVGVLVVAGVGIVGDVGFVDPDIFGRALRDFSCFSSLS